MRSIRMGKIDFHTFRSDKLLNSEPLSDVIERIGYCDSKLLTALLMVSACLLASFTVMANRVWHSTSVMTTASPLVFLPSMRSISQCPNSERSLIHSGRFSMDFPKIFFVALGVTLDRFRILTILGKSNRFNPQQSVFGITMHYLGGRDDFQWMFVSVSLDKAIDTVTVRLRFRDYL